MAQQSTIMAIICCGALLLATGCSTPEERAAEMYDTARFEEQQFNPEHARELYRQIIREYPGTAGARRAGQALDELDRTAASNGPGGDG